MSETVTTAGTSGFAALVGRLQLRIVSGDAWFEVEGPGGERLHPSSVEIEAPGATVIGCGGDADCQLAGPSTRGVSRRHLLLQPAGRQWTALDCSKNGSRELIHNGGRREWQRLQPGLPVPVVPEMRLKLGVDLELKLEPVQESAPGTTTATDDGARSAGERIPDFQLEQIARSLLAPRRSGSNAIPSITDLAKEAYLSRQHFHKKIEALGELPEVKPLLAGKPRTKSGGLRSQDVADALAIAFPYLTAPGPAD